MEIGVSLSPNVSKFGPLLFSGNLDDGLSEVSSLGYNGVELSLRDSNQIDQGSLINELVKLNLSVFAIATGQTYITDGCSLYSSEADKRATSVERIRGHIDFASHLGCMVIIGGIRGKIEADDSAAWQKEYRCGNDAIARCLEYAERKEIILLLEPVNRYETNVINTVWEGLELIEELGSCYLQLLPDTFHMNIEEASLVQSLTQAVDKLGYIHFADSNRLAPGWGHIDFPEILRVLKALGYTNPIGVEILPQPDDSGAATQSIQYLRMVGC